LYLDSLHSRVQSLAQLVSLSPLFLFSRIHTHATQNDFILLTDLFCITFSHLGQAQNALLARICTFTISLTTSLYLTSSSLFIFGLSVSLDSLFIVCVLCFPWYNETQTFFFILVACCLAILELVYLLAFYYFVTQLWFGIIIMAGIYITLSVRLSSFFSAFISFRVPFLLILFSCLFIICLFLWCLRIFWHDFLSCL
jgi:hypothetical protein